ncbi:hypothetical protein [Syntrophus sp. (in: bacteria)]|uniref:hypothetical protein n=1 Tax=Syntrophus sp. (in: bacteria) TaxID=48412 RepID=UPI00345F0D13
MLGVDVEIQEGLFDLAAVNLDGPEVLVEFSGDGELLPRSAEQGRALLDELVDVDGLYLIPAAPGEAQELPGKAGGALNLFIDVL